MKTNTLLKIITFAALSLAGLAPHLPAKAQESDKPLVGIRLLTKNGTIEPGRDITVGIEQTIAPGWHTYWQNPGDSGTAPRITWRLPPGFKTGPLQWPAPHKMTFGPLLNYGYENAAILLQTIKAPENLPQTPLTLEADIEILVCKEECIPEYGTYSLTLNDPAAQTQDSAALFETAKSALPQPVNWPVSFSENNGAFMLRIAPGENRPAGVNWRSAEFFPADWGLVENAAEPETTIEQGEILLQQKRGERPLGALETTTGIIALTGENGQKYAYEIIARQSNSPAAQAAPTQTFKDAERTATLGGALLFALLGGLILNLMPCVFPVLSLKALSLVKIAEKSPAAARYHGIAYTAGIILSFLAISAVLLVVKASGQQIGWGFQLQNPAVVAGLGLLLLLIGLNLAGFFEIANPFGNFGGKLTRGGGYTASFFTGILATLVATPCTAPFMAGAIAYALLQDTVTALAVFAALGLGLALPYLALSFIPALQKSLPRPGRWMETLRKILSVPMFLAALWLGWVFAQQIAPQHEEYAFGAPFSPATLENALSSDAPVFVEMTAAWCITCKVNHKTSLDISATKDLFERHNVRYLIGDWTNQNEDISQYLAGFGRSGVPLYVYYAPPQNGARPEPELLPQVLTPAIVERTITQNSSQKGETTHEQAQ